MGIEPAAERVYYPVSSGQRRLFILEQLEETGTSYNMPTVLIIEGQVDRERLETAFVALVQRHEILRTSLEMLEGEAVQRIHEEVEASLYYAQAQEEEAEELVKGFIRPFDLSCAPLVRGGIIQLEEAKFILLFDMHHIISDGVTTGILVREFMDLYEGKDLPQQRLQYKDYAVWQQGFNQSEAYQKQESYWLETFAGEIPVLNLPTDEVRPSSRQFEGGRISFTISKETIEGLKQVAAEQGATLYMALLAAYNVLLFKYTGQEDIVVGSPIAARPMAD
ncbi:condensation domain-containing protein, partial [Paenibacillus sp. Marseille-Q9583]